MVLATAEMLKHDYVRQRGETTGTNSNEAISASKEKKEICVCAVCEVMVEYATTPALDGKKSVYNVFKNSSHSNGIDVLEYKHMLCKELDTKLMLEEIIGIKRKRVYNFSDIVEVTKKARMDNESG
eukprot:4151065-Ditylum_brightwellii.AAC.1